MKIALFGFFNDARKELRTKEIGFFSDGEGKSEDYEVRLLSENAAPKLIGTISKELYSEKFQRLCPNNAITFATLEKLCMIEEYTEIVRAPFERICALFCNHAPRQTTSPAEQRFLIEYMIGNGNKNAWGWGDSFGHFCWECLQPDE